MRRRHEPFVMYYRGPVSFTLVPRGFKGWLQTAIWAATLVLLVLWFDDHTDRQIDSTSTAAAVFLFCMGFLAWLIGGIWWMVAHAQRVDVSEMLRERQKKRQRERRERERQKQQHDT